MKNTKPVWTEGIINYDEKLPHPKEVSHVIVGNDQVLFLKEVDEDYVTISEFHHFIKTGEIPRHSEGYLWLIGSRSATIGADYDIK